MGSVESHLEVINNTSTDIVNTSVNAVDSYDWEGGSRPDHNFQGVTISCRGGSVQRRQELNKSASHCPFTMTLYFADGSQDVFHIHQRYAIDSCASFQHITRSHDIFYNSSGNKLVIRVENTQEQQQNERAKEKNKQGEAAMKQKRYEAAITKFDEALSLANQSSTINLIRRNKSESCNEIAKDYLRKAWDLEADSTQDKAQTMFNQAKSMFKQAQVTPEQQHNLNVVNLKIDGNRIFNEAKELEKEAFELLENSHIFHDYTIVQSMYEEALIAYEEAARRFEEGTNIEQGKFEECLERVTERIQGVKKVVEGIDRAELSRNIKEKTEESEEEKQVDVVPS